MTAIVDGLLIPPRDWSHRLCVFRYGWYGTNVCVWVCVGVCVCVCVRERERERERES